MQQVLRRSTEYGRSGQKSCNRPFPLASSCTDPPGALRGPLRGASFLGSNPNRMQLALRAHCLLALGLVLRGPNESPTQWPPEGPRRAPGGSVQERRSVCNMTFDSPFHTGEEARSWCGCARPRLNFPQDAILLHILTPLRCQRRRAVVTKPHLSPYQGRSPCPVCSRCHTMAAIVFSA